MRYPSITLVLLSLATPLAAQPITHGPFIGHTTLNSVVIWARAERAGPLELSIWPEDGGQKRNFVAEARPERDLCVVWTIKGLDSKRAYRYHLAGPGGQEIDDARFRFTTARRHPEPHVLKIAFGSCAKEDEGTAAVWRRIHQESPDAIVLLGDTPYIDSTDIETQRRRQREFAAFPAMRDLLRSTPYYATWDDHDFGRNDTDGRLEGKENSRRAFVEYHANGSYGDGERGIYTSFRRVSTEVFLLDTRTFAATEPSPFDPEKPTLLGRAQWDWLRRGLRGSGSTFNQYTGDGIMALFGAPIAHEDHALRADRNFRLRSGPKYAYGRYVKLQGFPQRGNAPKSTCALPPPAGNPVNGSRSTPASRNAPSISAPRPARDGTFA